MHVRTKSRWTSERAESPRAQEIERKDGSVVAVVEAVSLSGQNDPRTRLAFLSGDDGCCSSGGTQLPHLPVELVSSLFFLPFCIQVFKGLIPLKTEKMFLFFF